MCDLSILLGSSDDSNDTRKLLSKASLLKKNSQTKVSKRLLIEKCHINNISKKPYKIIVPRIIDTDIRKQYPVMWMNMVNSGNIISLSTFMNKFTSRGCIYETILRDYNCKMTAPIERFEIDDISQLIAYFDAMHEIVPDHTYTYRNAEVKTRSDTFKSIITIDFELKGTKLFNVRPKRVFDMIAESSDIDFSCSSSVSSIQSKDTMKNSTVSPSSCSASLTSSFDDEIQSVQSINNHWARRMPVEVYCEPRPIVLEVRVTLVVEDPKKQAKITTIRADTRIICD